ncbi:MAG: proline dehydrogenase family protein [Acidobacteria bacterium]|nr:proline dehydrogenase family protein [Acidobacteriota bacterium]MBI3263351.1 proline dehydrogenase family protein [Acidobacteriota bacterium]
MFDAVSKGIFHGLARSRLLERLASRYGMATPDSFARRFIAGERIDEAIEVARALERRGLTYTLDSLGESVQSLAQADAATRDYLQIIQKVVDAGIGRNLSIKLSQLGLDIDRASCTDNLRRILDLAERHQFFVRVDMEGSPHTAVTLDIFETLWRQGYRHMGVVLQSCLIRSQQDMRRMTALGASIRVVKGAYKEPKSVAYQKKAEVDGAFVRMTRYLLVEGRYPAIATHDPAMIEATRACASEHHIASDRFEFQMLYGIRRDLQAALTREGFGMRIYIPFGRQWFRYFMRRLGERPANIEFVLRGIFQERPPNAA